MAHVTMFRFKASPGKRQAVVDQFEKWDREHKAQAIGFQRSLLVSSNDDPDEFMAAVSFRTTENYSGNSDRQEQAAWYRELRANLISDPEWFNGMLVRETMA